MESLARRAEPSVALVECELDRELREVDAAIALVRSGVARVVTIANLRHRDDVLDRLLARGDDRSIEFEPRRQLDDDGRELAVRLLSA